MLSFRYAAVAALLSLLLLISMIGIGSLLLLMLGLSATRTNSYAAYEFVRFVMGQSHDIMSTYSPMNDSIFINGFRSGRISTPVISPPSVFVKFSVAVANFVSIIIHPSSSLCSPDWLTLSAVGHKHGHEMIRDGDNMYGQ